MVRMVFLFPIRQTGSLSEVEADHLEGSGCFAVMGNMGGLVGCVLTLLI